jgi:hypothetical protein
VLGDHRPIGRDRIRSRPKNLKPVATQKKIPVTTRNRSRSRKIFRSRPVIGRDPENFSGRDQEIFQKIYQDIQLDESNLKFSIGSRPKKFQHGRLIPVATVFGSRSDFFLGRDPYSVAILKNFGSRPRPGRGPQH